MEILLEMQPGIKETRSLGKSRRENIQPVWSGQLSLHHPEITWPKNKSTKSLVERTCQPF